MAAGRRTTSSSGWAATGRAIAGPDDVRRVLDEVNTAGLDRGNTALAPHLVRPAAEAAFTEADLSRVLPCHPAIAQLLPWPGGIRRGTTVAAVGSMTLLMVLLAGAMTEGSYAAVVGIPQFGALAAAEIGVPLDRLALVPAPGPDWPTVVSALIDGIDIIAVAAPAGTAERTTQALINRARQRGTVLIPTTAWAGTDLALTVTARTWTGLGHGRGRLRRHQLTVQAAGRGRAAQPRTATLTLAAPGPFPTTPAATAPAPAEPPAAAAAGWAPVQPNDPPADPWGDLTGHVARNGPERRVRGPKQ